MHISLCNADFYPLIQIQTKGMSYADKVAYRVQHGVPRTIDDWIASGKMCTKAPAAIPLKHGPCRECQLWQDDVECILSIVHKEVSIQ